MTAIEITNFSKIYRKGFWGIKVPAVVDISLSIKKNIITGFVGPNGAGKTTTIKTIMGLIRPTAGTIKINGIEVSNCASRKGVAYLSEQPYFYGHLTVCESLEFAAHLIGVTLDKGKSEIIRVLDIVELSHKAKSKVKEMSKGMQQRLNMAQALLGKPELMILDEPMSGMDPPGRRLFRSLFKNLAENGITIFFSTHVLEDIESVCDEVVVVSKGKVTYSGAVSELLNKGIMGTEMVISTSDTQVREYLLHYGCKIESDRNGVLVFTIPKEIASPEIQKFLSEKNVFPSRIVNRTVSMEDLLYGKNGRDTEK
jgi:ABC-2 type transport system ATP-binding protein